MLRAAAPALLAAFATVASAEAQVARDLPERPQEEAVDSSELRGLARGAQRRFERQRIRYLPYASGSYVGSCDERVGRFCTWYDEYDWHPEPEDPRIAELREELIRRLDEIAEEFPGDDWLLGQRVWYRTEGGDWQAALAVARACGGSSVWWCAALEGFALHGQGRYPSALEAFRRALDLMDPDQARRWRVPRWPLDGDARDYLEDLPADSLPRALERLWTLADPLWLVPGNDRLTAHYARWTVARIREDARNPFQIPWSGDLDQLTVRHGWEVGWEREWSRSPLSTETVVGHKHPEGRDFMPPGDVLRDPAAADDAELRADRTEPRSLYAPGYAPLLLPAEGQLAVFPRGGEMAVVASHFLPADTTFAARHEHPRPWLDSGGEEGTPDEAGLFLWPVAGGAPLTRRVQGRGEGALLLTAPAGDYVVSVESWSPTLLRAGRRRVGLSRDTLPPDLPTLSDLLLLRRGGEEPPSLEAALPRVLPAPRVAVGDGVAVLFEVAGVGGGPQTVDLSLTVERADRGFFRRAGEFLGLVDRAASVSVAWAEETPGDLRPLLRWLELELRDVEPGRYKATLTLSLAGRGAVESSAGFRVESPHR